MDALPKEVGERKFTKISDGITKRGYVIAEVFMMNGRQFNIIEVERERRSLSTLILSSLSRQDWDTIYNHLLMNLVNASGTWSIKSLTYFEGQGVKARILLGKFL
ncbi:Tn7-like element transposition protein TnsE [Salicibibacter kimchii]|uniref:TnsE C-terminal domain-containing protein n=1 Tax=Salicibibacter kimchii TaxID=2099786 RepID=A0A345C1M1_9BACI|nr:Tn7-like element transposition protein TnsE [Salicibibacter kimchii]AXF57102.1 hypothetical protein DT065_14580 [Salicibibacter kimchii]